MFFCLCQEKNEKKLLIFVTTKIKRLKNEKVTPINCFFDYLNDGLRR